VSDFVPGYEASQWFGAGLHKKTSTEIVNTLNKEINIALADAKMKARLADLGTTVFPGSAADLGKFVAEETDKWGAVVKSSGAKPD
jgi:tripartite-type tricarboxylate transporter receptor subunit TctC